MFLENSFSKEKLILNCQYTLWTFFLRHPFILKYYLITLKSFPGKYEKSWYVPAYFHFLLKRDVNHVLGTESKFLLERYAAFNGFWVKFIWLVELNKLVYTKQDKWKFENVLEVCDVNGEGVRKNSNIK